MNKMMLGFYLLFSLLLLLGLTVAGQEEAIDLIHTHEPRNPSTPNSIAVSVALKDLPLVSSSVLAAETWLKSHVLTHYPSTNITTIIVGNGILCNNHHQHQWSLVLPSLQNLKHSLTRWGLLNEIKLSASFSSHCFHLTSPQKNTLNPLLTFLQSSSFPYTINPSPHSSLSTHQEFLDTLGFSKLRDIRVMRKRRLSSLEFAPEPGTSFAFAPNLSPPELGPGNPPDVSVDPPLPFCIPPVEEAPSPSPSPSRGEEGEKVGLWCVAKPAVPAEKLQEAMDYACGVAGADCEEITPNGKCFNPDNLVAHASYAFNSYWQKTKKRGGSCSFDGTAILINSDPSYLHCRFELS